MPSNHVSTPGYRKHSSRNVAVVTLPDAASKKRRNYYLGAYDTPESREAYHRLIAAWEAIDRRLPDAPAEPKGPSGSNAMTINELSLAYWRFAKTYYAAPEVSSIKSAIRVINRLFGSTPAVEFGPNLLRLVRDAMVHGDPSATPPRRPWSRTHINDQIRRTCAIFRWAASQEMLPITVYQQLKALSALRRGRTTAREPAAVEPVQIEVVNAVRPFLSRQINALIDLQLLTGSRGGELFTLRRRDIDRSRKVWTHTAAQHKTAWRGKSRTIFFGPRAQATLAPFMLRPDDAYLFSPAEAEKERRQQLHEVRKTPLSCGNRPGTNVREDLKREPGDHYTKDSYCRAIHRACLRAFPIPAELARHRVAGKKSGRSKRWETTEEWRKRLGEENWQKLQQWLREHRWHPHQLRHTAATLIRREFGLEAAQVTLGHSSAMVTDAVYAERDLAKVEEVMLKIG